jgi:hypothetical protein
MRVIRTRRRLALFLGMAVLVAFGAAGAAYALTAKSFKYSSPKTGYVRISHLAFAPDGFGGNYLNVAYNGLSTPGSDACLTAGVDLPVGSRVRSITFYFKSGPSTDFHGVFWRMRLATGTPLFLAGVLPHINSGTPTSATDGVPAVSQPVTAGRAYGVYVCPGSDGTFFGARVKYTYTSAGS